MAIDYSQYTSLIKPKSTGGLGVPDYGSQFADYQSAADAHNYGNGNFAFTNPDTWSQGLSNASMFVAGSVVSAADSFYNSGVTVANWFGADAELADTHAQLAALDDDTAAYYTKNKGSIDMAGFVVSSLIPGLAGVKLLNAGQKVLRASAESGLVGSSIIIQGSKLGMSIC